MNQPSGSRNFFGRVVDRILPGNNYNAQTGQYSNIGRGVAGLGARLAASAFLGPAAGALVGQGANALINRLDSRVGGVSPEAIPLQGGMSYQPQPIAVSQGMAPSMSLGFGGPQQSWGGYMQGAGSLSNFGNQQFGTGMVSQPGSWSPASQWGSDVMSGGSFGGQLGNNMDSMGGSAPSVAQAQAVSPASRFGTASSSGPVSMMGMNTRGGIIGPKSPHERNQYLYKT